jgi:hypothetical protein
MRYLAVAITVALAVTAVTAVASLGPAAGAITTAERQEAEFEIADSGIVTRLEAALGDSFGGVWLEPSTGQLHVGVPTAASRRSAEVAADRAGVAGIVVETPVTSAWAELEAAQDRWAKRLADLFERAEVTTGLRAQYNALEVELGASVPDSRRVAVERAAAADSVNVRIAVSQSDHFRVREQARCVAWAPGKANCNPTIVAGVTIVHENETGTPCTAGPAVMPVDASSAATATERRILTAGHCIDPNGKKKWFAYNKNDPGSIEIGSASYYLNEHVADIGVIWIEPMSSWLQVGFTRVNPTIALWNAKNESDPIPVYGERVPFENAETCISGQSSGTVCGKILVPKKTIKNAADLAEVNIGVTKVGDSGAPWYAKDYAESGAGLVEGVHVGLNSGTGKAIFQPLKIGLERLKEKKGAEYELVTVANEERRHPVPTAGKYPSTTSGKGTETADEFTAFGSAVKCSENEFDGELTEASTALELTPTYKTCAISSLPVTFTNNGCKYKFTPKEETAEGQFSSAADVVCPAEKAGLQFDVYASHANQTSGTVMCTLTMLPQTGLKSGTLKNSGSNLVLEKATIEAVKMKLHRNSFFCPLGSGTVAETSSGVYDLNKAVTLSGTSGGEAVKLDIGGA